MVKFVQTSPEITEMSTRQALFSPLFIGAGVGLFGYLLTLGIRYLFINNLFCRSADMANICNDGWNIAWITAHVIVGVASVFALVRAGVYRPLLVVLAAFVALWGLGGLIQPLSWPLAFLAETALFALAYALFAWLASLSKLFISGILIVIVVVVIRLLGLL